MQTVGWSFGPSVGYGNPWSLRWVLIIINKRMRHSTPTQLDSPRLEGHARKKKEKYLIRWFACLWLSKVCRRIKLTFSERVHLKYHFRRVQKPFEVFLAKRPWFISAIRPTWISENLVQTQEERGGERRMMERLKPVCLVSQARDAYGIFEKSTSTLQGLLVESYKCVYICSFVSLRGDRKNFKRISLNAS